MNDYLRFIDTIKDQIQVFKEKQARSVKEMSDRSITLTCSPFECQCYTYHQAFLRDVTYREDKLLKEWEDEKAAETRKVASQGGDAGDGTCIMLIFPCVFHSFARVSMVLIQKQTLRRPP